MRPNPPIQIQPQRTAAIPNLPAGQFAVAPAWRSAIGELPAQKTIVQKNLNRMLNVAKPLPAGNGGGVIAAPAWPWLEFFLKIPLMAFNAAFTAMGRKNVSYFVKKSRLRMNAEFRAKGTYRYTLKNGAPFVVHRDNRLSELFFLEGAYEPLETVMVSKIVRPGDVVLDLGANVGYFTALLDGLVKPAGEVHAFEPGHRTFAKLRQTKELLGLDRVTLHPQAICAKAGQVDFWSSTTGQDAQQKTTNTPALSQDLRLDSVAATTVDLLAAELEGRGAKPIAFVKCDIEGAEPAMLRGAEKLLLTKNPPVWLIEHNREALADHGATSADLMKFFQGCDIYFVPLDWPPSLMSVPQAKKWGGVSDELPDECNLIVLPARGIFSQRAAALRQANLLA